MRAVSYSQLIYLTRNGREVKSRLGLTNEVLDVTLQVKAGTIVGRKSVNVELGMMEVLLVLAGRHDPDAIARVAPRADLTLFTRAMSYGPRIFGQMPGLMKLLWTDPDTRRAVLHVSTSQDGFGSDLPCTQTVQFLKRFGTLHSIVSMRSWDVVLGAPYDLMVFGGLTMAVAKLLGYRPGMVSVRAGSCHLYRSHAHLVDRVDEFHDGSFAMGDTAYDGWGEVCAAADLTAALGWDKDHEQPAPFVVTARPYDDNSNVRSAIDTSRTRGEPARRNTPS